MYYIDEMQILSLSAETYLSEDEAFHLARSGLPNVRPSSPHDHDFYEVFLVERGSVSHWINGRVDRLNEGELVFIRPADCHALWSARTKGGRLLNLMFAEGDARRLAENYGETIGKRFFWSDSKQPVQITLDPEHHIKVLNGLNHLLSSQRSRLELDGFLLRLFADLEVPHNTQAHLPIWLGEGVSRADAPVFLRSGTRGLAQACGRSPEHVARMVQKHLGQSPSEIMNAKRMTYAARLLLSTDLTIEDIGLDGGYQNQSYFFRLFKKHHGMTPRQYRRANFRNPLAPHESSIS